MLIIFVKKREGQEPKLPGGIVGFTGKNVKYRALVAKASPSIRFWCRHPLDAGRRCFLSGPLANSRLGKLLQVGFLAGRSSGVLGSKRMNPA